MSEHKSAVIALTEAEFDDFVQKATKPVLVDFWAPWCSPCRFLTPLFEKFAREFSDKAIFVKVNRDEALALRARYEIVSIPRLVLVQGGERVGEEVGLADYPVQRNRVKKMLGLSTRGRLSTREKKFRDAVKAAADRWSEATNETSTAYQTAIDPFLQKARGQMTANNEALAAGTVDAEQHKAADEAIKAEFNTARDNLKPLLDAYLAASGPAEVAYCDDLLATTNLLYPLTAESATPVEKNETASEEGQFCAIGDPTCGA